MKFDEQGFRHLVDETKATIIRLGTTSHAVLDRYKRFTEMLVEHLKTLDQPFELTRCLEWVNSLEHDPASELSASYVDWKALHRFIHLLAEQQAGTLTEWRHYLCFTPELPETDEYKNILIEFQEAMNEEGKYATTMKSYSSMARRLLLYLESVGVTKFSDVNNQNLLDYFQTDRFKNRNLKGFQTELCVLKKFLRFAVDAGYTACETLPYALPKIRQSRNKIITTIDEKVEADLLEDEPDSLVNKRDQAILLLALHTGLRSCDIRALRFCDIDWEKETIHIRQKKTGVDLEIPIDSATQNAIIDYILNERRDCEQEYIFVTSVGPIKKLARRHYRMKYRTQGTASYEKLPHDGLHIYRRTFASRLLQSGTPLPLISEMLGHIDKKLCPCVSLNGRSKNEAVCIGHLPDTLPKGGILMYASKFGPIIEEMLIIRRRSGLQLKFIGFFLDDFDTFCAKEYPEATLLTKEIAETWIHSSDSPSRHHMARRVSTMKHIGEYQQSLGLNAYVPNYRIKRPKAEEPHLFTDEQLALFFETVDTQLIPTETYPYKDTMFPVFFRLVYCCGLRSSEACNLKVSDIDFPKGTICIYQSKGMKDREIPLSEDLLDLCYRFDRYYQKQFPDRTYFFKPNQEREHMTSGDVSKIFQAILKKAGLLELPGKRFTTHGLRHLFAVQNIKKCADAGEDFYNWIQYLCWYMGHKHIRYTLYYLHITSQLFPVYREKLNALEKGIGVVYAEE